VVQVICVAVCLHSLIICQQNAYKYAANSNHPKGSFHKLKSFILSLEENKFMYSPPCFFEIKALSWTDSFEPQAKKKM